MKNIIYIYLYIRYSTIINLASHVYITLRNVVAFTIAKANRDGHVIGLNMQSLSEMNSLMHSGIAIENNNTHVHETA